MKYSIRPCKEASQIYMDGNGMRLSLKRNHRWNRVCVVGSLEGEDVISNIPEMELIEFTPLQIEELALHYNEHKTLTNFELSI